MENKETKNLEEVKEEREAERSSQNEADERDFEIRRLLLENEALKRREAERILENDLALVQTMDPGVKKIEDLGEVFIALRAGGVPCREAYRAVASLNIKKDIPQMGDIAGMAEEKEYFTPEEVKRMSEREVKKNYEKIRKSMSKWKA